MTKYTLVQFTNDGKYGWGCYGIKRARLFWRDAFMSGISYYFWSGRSEIYQFCHMNKTDATKKIKDFKNGAWFNQKETFYKEIPDETTDEKEQ